MNFNVNQQVVKLLEIIERSAPIRRMGWALILVLLVHVIRWW